MKGGKYAKTIAKIRFTGIFRIQDISQEMFHPNLKEFVWRRHAGRAPTWRTETNRNICYRVLLQKREFFP